MLFAFCFSFVRYCCVVEEKERKKAKKESQKGSKQEKSLRILESSFQAFVVW